MWKCGICDAEVDDDTWTTCWKCASPRDLDPAGASEIRAKFRERISRFQQCLRCQSRLEYAGTKMFRDETARGLFLGDLFVEWDFYDVYFCPQCGKVEFYIDGIGDELRGEAPDS